MGHNASFYKAAGVSEASYFISDQQFLDQCTASSEALLAAMLRYGLTHGLPNMTGAMIHTKARQMGIIR